MLDSSIKEVTDIVENTKTKVETLVNNSKAKVDSGTRTAKECGEALDEIMHNVSSVNEMVREIALASEEQSTGVQEVTNSIQDLDQTTHQNSTLANQSSEVAEVLKSQAKGLENTVSELMEIVNGTSNDLDANLLATTKENNVLEMPKRKDTNESSSYEEPVLKKVSGSDV